MKPPASPTRAHSPRSCCGLRTPIGAGAAPIGTEELDAGSVLPPLDVIRCVRVAHTTLVRLAESARTLRGGGWRLHGLVLWDAG